MKDIIRGLIDTKERRGLAGQAAIYAWVTEALAVLLKAELERIERDERVQDYLRRQ